MRSLSRIFLPRLSLERVEIQPQPAAYFSFTNTGVVNAAQFQGRLNKVLAANNPPCYSIELCTMVQIMGLDPAYLRHLKNKN